MLCRLLLPFLSPVLQAAAASASLSSIMCAKLGETIILCWVSPSLGRTLENVYRQNIIGLTSFVLLLSETTGLDCLLSSV